MATLLPGASGRFSGRFLRPAILLSVLASCLVLACNGNEPTPDILALPNPTAIPIVGPNPLPSIAPVPDTLPLATTPAPTITTTATIDKENVPPIPVNSPVPATTTATIVKENAFTIPVHTPAPAASSPTSPGSPDFDYYSVHPDAILGEVYGTFSAVEQACAESKLDEEQLAEALNQPLFWESDVEGLQLAVMECISADKTAGLFYSSMMGELASLESNASLTSDQKECLREVVDESDILLIVSRYLVEDSTEADRATLAFSLKVLACVPELVANSVGRVPHTEPTATPPPNTEAEIPQPTFLWGVLNESYRMADKVVDGILYTGGNSRGWVYALDARTGVEVWSFRPEERRGPIHGPIVAGGVVYTIDSSPLGEEIRTGRLYALDAATGEELWRFQTAGVMQSRPVLAYGVVYLTDHSSQLYAVDSTSGEALWVVDVLYPDNPFFIPTAPVPLGQRVYVAGEDEGSIFDENDSVYTITALDANTGETVWTLTTDNYVKSKPVAQDGVVYLTVLNAAYALDEATGELIWSYRAEEVTNEHSRGYDSRTLIADGIYYLAPGDNLYALDAATGEVLWVHRFRGSAAEPLVAQGWVFGWSEDGFVFALDAATGEEIWTWPTAWASADKAKDLWVSEGVLYARYALQYLHAIDIEQGRTLWNLPGKTLSSYQVHDGTVFQATFFGINAYATP